MENHTLPAEKLELWKQQIAAFSFPRWNELPEIDLYMDQVVGYLSQKLAVFYDAEDAEGKGITATMINNYVKQQIIMSPVKKRYDRAAVSALMALFCIKNVLSIGLAGNLIRLCCWYDDPQRTYDRFCHVFEDVLHHTVAADTVDALSCLAGLRGEDCLFVTTAIAFANTIYAEKQIMFAQKENQNS